MLEEPFHHIIVLRKSDNPQQGKENIKMAEDE